MQVTVEFHCKRCGLLTPAFSEVPDDVPDGQPLNFVHDCFHCDAPLSMVLTAGAARDAERKRLAK